MYKCNDIYHYKHVAMFTTYIISLNYFLTNTQNKKVCV